MKVNQTENGRKVMQTLLSLHSDRHLADMIDAQLREDRAPQGSMAKALARIMLKD